MKVVIRTVIVSRALLLLPLYYYRCTTTAVLLPLYYYRYTATAVLLPLYQYGQTLGKIHGAKHHLNRQFLHTSQSRYTQKKRNVPHHPRKIYKYA